MTSEVIKFSCKKCLQKYSARPEQAGNKGTCKKCGARLKVPGFNSLPFGKFKEIATNFGIALVGAVFLIGILIYAIYLIKGGVYISEKALPWLSQAMWYVLMVDIFFLLPLSTLRKRKAISSAGFLVSSYVFGATLWFWGLLLTYFIWGGIAVFIGLFLLGIGIVPIAILATAFTGEWTTTGQLLLLILLTYGSRFYSVYLDNHADQMSYEIN